MTSLTSLQTPEQITKQYKSILRRVDLVEGCWIWKGSVNSGSGKPIAWKMGSTRNKPRYISVERWLFEHKHFVPLGMRISRSLVTVKICKSELCVNPDHHTTVTQSERHAGLKHNTRKKRNYE